MSDTAIQQANAYYTAENHGPFELHALGDLELEEGGVIADCQLAYTTFGELSAAKDNAILMPTWYSGTHGILGQTYIGEGHARILLMHVLPNSLTPLVVQLTYVFAIAILAEAVLSFIGVGPPPPLPTFGNIIADGRDFVQEAPWVSLFPGLAIAISVLGLNLIGDGLRDALDPRMKVELR